MNARTTIQQTTDKKKKEQENPTQRQIRNIRQQNKSLAPPLRGNTTTHVGKPKNAPYVSRSPRPASTPRIVNNKATTNKQVEKKGGVNANLRGRLGARSTNLGSTRLREGHGNAGPFSNRTASTDFVGNSTPDKIQERMKKKSPWFDSIMCPITGGGVKIPDPVGTDTATYQHVEQVTLTSNSTGVVGLRIVCPYINNYVYGAPINQGSNYQTTNADSTAVTGSPVGLNWRGSNILLTGAYAFDSIPAKMKAAAQSHRVVSCSVTAECEVSTQDDSGEMCAFVKPFSCNASTVNYSTLQSQWDTTIIPVNKKKALAARWYPVSSDYNPFNGAVEIESDNPPTISYQDFVDPNVQYPGNAPEDVGVIPWEIGIVCTGMQASSVVRFKMVVNYELIPLTQTSMVSGSPSPIDPTEEQLVNSWVSDCPVTSIVPDAQAAAPAKQSTVKDEEPTGLGMIFNVFQEIAPYIKAGAALL